MLANAIVSEETIKDPKLTTNSFRVDELVHHHPLVAGTLETLNRGLDPRIMSDDELMYFGSLGSNDVY